MLENIIVESKFFFLDFTYIWVKHRLIQGYFFFRILWTKKSKLFFLIQKIIILKIRSKLI